MPVQELFQWRHLLAFISITINPQWILVIPPLKYDRQPEYQNFENQINVIYKI